MAHRSPPFLAPADVVVGGSDHSSLEVSGVVEGDQLAIADDALC